MLSNIKTWAIGAVATVTSQFRASALHSNENIEQARNSSGCSFVSSLLWNEAVMFFDFLILSGQTRLFDLTYAMRSQREIQFNCN